MPSHGPTRWIPSLGGTFFIAFVGFACGLTPLPASGAEPTETPASAAQQAPPKTAEPEGPDRSDINRDLGGRSGRPANADLGSLGKASTSLFGLTGEGSSFVYVLDRSGSMGGAGRVALAAAKSELSDSLQNLDRVQRFQLIFYNQAPVIFNPTGRVGKLAFATDANKERAERFINSITADGGTHHEDALKMAIRLRPDVIFFLSDAGDPQLTPQQLGRIHQWAAGIKINVIEFGQGPKPPGDNFLTTLARENDGQYTYIDIAQGYHGPRM